mgnify:CR=1 FL=1|jgi:glycosyltransferase involved in cell wall biosynthesis
MSLTSPRFCTEILFILIGNTRLTTPCLYVDVSIIRRENAGTGIQRVVRAIWNVLQQNMDAEFELVPVAGSPTKGYRRIRDNFLERPLRRLPIPWMRARLTPKSGDVFLGLDLSTRVVTRNKGQLARWRRRGVKVVFIVYDLLPALRPDWFDERATDYYRAWLNLITIEADHLACISHTVANDLVDWMDALKIKGPQVTTLRLGAAISASAPSVGLPQHYCKTLAWVQAATCVMVVGTVEPRKGYDQVLAAFEELWDQPKAGEDFRLLIVGRPGWMTNALQQRLRTHRLYGDRLLWIDDASDEYLELMYGACWGLLMASHGEGFGLPLLEAAAHRKPVLARDLPIFREIGPAGVVYFEGETAPELAKALRQWRRSSKPVLIAAADLCWSNTVEDLESLLASLKSTKDR